MNSTTQTTHAAERESRRPLVQGPRAEFADAPDFLRAVAEGGAVPTVALGNLERRLAERRLRESLETLNGHRLAVALNGGATRGQNPAFDDHLELVSELGAEGPAVLLYDAPVYSGRRLLGSGVDDVVFEVRSPSELNVAVDEGLRQFLGTSSAQEGGIAALANRAAEIASEGTSLSFWAAPDARREDLEELLAPAERAGLQTGVVVPGAAYTRTSAARRTDALPDGLAENGSNLPDGAPTTIEDLHRKYRLSFRASDASSEETASTGSRDHSFSTSSSERETAMNTKSTTSTDSYDGTRDIAVVGIGATMPEADSADTFWNNIAEKVYAIRDVPADRWDPELYWDPDPEAPDKTYSKIGGWVRDFEFDRKWYRIPPLVVENMDNSQLMAMDTTKEALENAGYLESDFDNENCAVILGNTLCGELRDWTNLRVHYPEFEMDAKKTLLEEAGDRLDQREIDSILGKVEERFKARRNEINEDSMPGELPNVIAGRVANAFNLRGPNFVTDAACASSLSSVVQAVRGLRNQRWDVAVTGGVDSFMGPSAFVKFCKIGALSPDGSRPFDANANGFVMGEGCGILILKRLDDAVEDDDDIYGVIRGVGGSSDGAGKGITAPNPIGQKLALERAYEDAGYGPRSISLLEAHGTSTPVGDPTEFNSTVDVVTEDPGPAASDEIAVGSVKSMIGHLKAGAGAASLIKVSHALKNKTLPPTLNVESPHPDLNIDDVPFRIQESTQEWETDNGIPRRAGVSAFGFGGTNYHVTLEEFDPDRYGSRTFSSEDLGETSSTSSSGTATTQGTISGTSTTGSSAAETSGNSGSSGRDRSELEVDSGLMTFTGDSEEELEANFDAFAKAFEKRGLEAARPHLVPLESNNVEPPAGEYRLAVAYGDAEELEKQVDRIQGSFERDRGWNILANQGVFRSSDVQKGDVAMLFPGQGTQYLGMLSDLKEKFDVVEEVYAEADHVMRPVLGHDLSDVIDPTLWDRASKSRLMETEYTQPAVLTADTALLRLLRKFGLSPDVVAGHSLGEYGALVAAGVMPFPSALRTVARRGTAMADASPMDGDRGLMASVSGGPEEVNEKLREIDGYVVCANKNCPKQTIIAGLTEPVREAIEIFEEEGYMVDLLDVSHAFHTEVVAEGSEPLRRHLEDVDICTPEIPILTNVTGGYHPEDPDEIRDLLAEQVAAPVEWKKQIERMYEDGARTFIEVGPKSALTTFVESTLGNDREYVATHTNHPKEGGLVSLYRALGELWAEGVWTPQTARDASAELDAVTEPESADASKPAGASKPNRSPGLGAEGDLPGDPAPDSDNPAAPTADAQRPSRDEVLDTMLEVLCEKTGYDPDEIEYDFELEADLGVDTVKQAEILADVRERWGLEKDEDFRFSEYPTLERLADYVEERFDAGAFADDTDAPSDTTDSTEPESVDGSSTADATDTTDSADAPEHAGASPAPGEQTPASGERRAASGESRPSRDEVLDTMLEVLCEKTGYDPDEIEYDFELEADLGVDTVKQAEILADVRERWGLEKDEDFRFSEYPTLERLADYVEERFDAGAFADDTDAPSDDSDTADSADAPEPAGASADGPLPAGASDANRSPGLGAEGDLPGDPASDSENPAAPTADVERPSRDEILDTMLEVLCEKTGYDPAEIEYDFELEADLGVDTVKQAEILADVREQWGLEKDEDFRFSEYPTLERLADYVEERFDAGAFADNTDTPSDTDAPESTDSADAPEPADASEPNRSPGLGAEGDLPGDRERTIEAPPRQAALEHSASLDIEGEGPWTVAGGTSDSPREIDRHDIPASISISGGSLGLPGLDEMFDENAVERLLEGDNFIGQLPEQVREEIVDKRITRLEKHEDGGGELVEVTDTDEVVKLAAQAGEFDLGEDWNIPSRLNDALDATSQLAFAAGLEALRDAGLPLVPQYRETRSGKKLTDGWKLPDEVGDETGIIFATAFAGQDAFADELESYYTDDEYEFNHRLLLRMLGIANSRFAEYVGARGPNTKINNACASTTTALGIAQDWIEQGRCERVVVLSADDATGDSLFEWIGSGFLATGAASTEEDVEDAALPFDRRRDGMIVGMGAVGLVVERDGLPEKRGIEPLADIMGTHFVNSAHHPTRLDVDHIASEVGDFLGDVEESYELEREEIAPNTVFVSHETYTPARGGSADAEISAIRENFGDAAEDLVVANTKGYTGHAQGASIEEMLAMKSLQHQTVPAIANFEEPDPNLGNLRLAEGGEYPVDYALRFAAGFGSQLALALYRFRAREKARLADEARYLDWLSDSTEFDHPDLAIEDRTLRVREGQPDDRPTPPSDGPDGGGADRDSDDASSPTPEPGSGTGVPTEQPRIRAEGNSADAAASSNLRTSPEDAERFPTESILVEADTSAAYDPIQLKQRLEDKRIVILGGPMLVTNMMRRAVDRCGADVLVLEDSGRRTPLESEETVCDLSDQEAIVRQFDAFGPVDGIVDLLGFGQEKYEAETVHRVAQQSFHASKAWLEHLGDDPGEDHFWVSVTGMGGRLGFDQATSPLPVCGAVCGFTKSLGREWPETDVRVVDVPREGLYPDLGLQILAETFADVPSLEVGLLGGVRYLPVAVSPDEIMGHGAGESLAPDSDSTILLAGGAKGITASVAKDLADRYGCNLALVGRTELDHPDPLSVDMDEAKAEAKRRIDERGDRVTPVRVQRELKPLKSQRTIVENMGEMRQLGADVEYFSCDVADPGAVETLADEVRERFGAIDGVIHGAGAEISDLLAKKSVEDFDIVFRGKALGGLNLWAAVRDDEPDFFVTFSSVVSRFGNVGQADYCAANEVLNKLVAHINATSSVAGLSIDWTAWDEIGMAVEGSIKTILEHRGVEFLPPDIGAPMVADSLERGLAGEVMIAGDLGELSGPFRLRREKPGAAPATRREQLVFASNVTERDEDRAVVERVFDPERDRFLEDHVYEDVPVLPGVMGYEMMVEAAERLTGRSPEALSDVTFDRAIKLHHGEPLRVIATAERAGEDRVEVTLESERTVKTGRTVRNEHFTATAHLDEASHSEAETFVFDPESEYDAGPDKPEIYRRFFHTGVFQVMETVPHLGDDVVVGYGRKPTAKLVSDEARGRFVTDPMVREIAFQTTGLWGMIRNQKSYLPYGIGDAVQFDEAEPGERICARARRRAAEDTEHTIAFDVEVRADDGRLLQWMENVQLVGHRALTENEAFSEPPARRMTLLRLSHPEAQAVLSDRDLEASQILTDAESEAYERLRSERRRGEWLAARVAAKELVSRYARDFAGFRPDLASVAIVKDDNGAPHVEFRNRASKLLGDLPLPSLTLTHAGGVAIAGIAGPGPKARVGIDLEAIEERDETFAENYFTESERELSLGTGGNGSAEEYDQSTTWTALWSIKEAVSKALGLGLKLALGELLIEEITRQNGHLVAEMSLNGRAREAYDELEASDLEVRVRVDGSFALASAYLAKESTVGTTGVKQSANGNGRSAGNGSSVDPARAETDGTSEEFAAVAALLKHKGLLDAERTQKEARPRRDGGDVSSWKHGN